MNRTIIRRTSAWTISKLINSIDKNKMSYNTDIQRALVWNPSQKSLLIHSILMDIPIPPILISQRDKEMEIIDGKQRCNAIYSFIKNKYAFRNCPNVFRDDGEEIEMNGRKFSDLPDDLQETITNYNLSMTVFEQPTDEEIQEIFWRYNNGTAMKSADKTFVRAASKEMIVELCEHPIFDIALTEVARGKLMQRAIVIQSLMLLNNVPALSAKEMGSFLSSHEISDDEKLLVTSIYDKMKAAAEHILEGNNIAERDARKVIKKALSRTNIPTLVTFINNNSDISPEKLAAFFIYFFNGERKTSINEDYNEAAGAGSGHAGNVAKRAEILQQEYDDFSLENN